MKQTFRITIGIIVLVSVLTPLLSTPGMVSPGGVSIISTELSGSSGKEIFVRTKLDFARPETMKDFPQKIGQWHSTRGYEIEEEGEVKVPIEDASWAQEHWRSEKEGSVFKGEMNTKKLVVVKRSKNGEITERRVVLYYYVRDERMSVTKEITMVRLSALVPVSGSDHDAVEAMKKLAADTFPEMFEVKPEERTIAEMVVIKHGAPGFLVIAMLVSAPIIFMMLPFIKRKVFV